MGSLLYLQASHRSQGVLTGNLQRPLVTSGQIEGLPWDDRYKTYVTMAGLNHVNRIGRVYHDNALINALVERWRQETHTFHLPVGEMTITLEDVAVLLGLRVDGEALCPPRDLDWPCVVEELLGNVDLTTFRKGSRSPRIRISWLRNCFSYCPPDADESTVQKYARAYLLMLVGTVLFPDHFGDSISARYLPLFKDFNKSGSYSWGSGVLAFLYRELCSATKTEKRQIGGPIILLQMWSWERFPFWQPERAQSYRAAVLGCVDIDQRPPLGYRWSGCLVTGKPLAAYRNEINILDETMVNWMPYVGLRYSLPEICYESAQLWRTTAPLLHFWTVEMYNPERVSRQFGFYQTIPPFLRCTDEALHGIKRGNSDGWLTKYATYVNAWGDRWNLLLADQRPFDIAMHNAYMQWYSGATILHLREPNTYVMRDRIREMLGGGGRALGRCFQFFPGTTPEDPCEHDAPGMFAPPDGKMKYMLLDEDEQGESSCPGAKRDHIFTSIKTAKRSAKRSKRF
ncbi:hypothetical protein LUZ61_011694 [Rhynchospora tenuis]|uniref:Aminotransferase-like plant mobile domain-containing protein n=1 Tax=Rhynchospora tenuis TaxID=198213 RepID=A0AAD6A1H3_9POAL|nr:hypothetical protein LUZ61_011694 [Rhynchospora tenuis]